jgi:hypothetical protein
MRTNLPSMVGLLLVLLAWPITPAIAQEVGEVVNVRNAVGLLDGRIWNLEVKQPVRVGLTASLRVRPSFIRLFLEDKISAATRGASVSVVGSFDFEGQGEFTIEEARREEGTGKLFLGFKIPRGALQMALLGLLAHEIWVRTPQLTARPQGTYFRLLVDPGIGTFLATDEGAVLVELPGGESFLVPAGQWVLVPPAGNPQRDSIEAGRDPLDDSPLLDCCDFRIIPP